MELKVKYEGLKINKESVDKLFPKQDINVLGYESPIKMVTDQPTTEISKSAEENIWEAVVRTGVVVDKDELIKALQYDRDQYEKGYRNGYTAKASEVAREIFEEIDALIDMLCAMTGLIVIGGKYTELKAKYIGEDTNVRTNTEET